MRLTRIVISALLRDATSNRETVVVREMLVPAEAPTSNPSLPRRLSSRPSASRHASFEILTLIARGFGNREIATQPFVPKTQAHCSRAFDKLGGPPRPGRPARQRTRPPGVATSPESTISAPFLQYHPKG
jgi:hypothetical protein